MPDLRRHELLTLVFDKLCTIESLVDEVKYHEDRTVKLADMRHALEQIRRVAERAKQLIDECEPSEDREPCEVCGV